MNNKIKWALALTIGAGVGAGIMAAVDRRKFQEFKETAAMLVGLVQEKAASLVLDLNQMHGDDPKVGEE